MRRDRGTTDFSGKRAALYALVVGLPVLVYWEDMDRQGYYVKGLKGCYPLILREVWVDKELVSGWAELIPPLVKRMRDHD